MRDDERERDRRLLHEGLAALASMDDATQAAYLGEWDDWDAAPLAEPPGPGRQAALSARVPTNRRRQ